MSDKYSFNAPVYQDFSIVMNNSPPRELKSLENDGPSISTESIVTSQSIELDAIKTESEDYCSNEAQASALPEDYCSNEAQACALPEDYCSNEAQACALPIKSVIKVKKENTPLRQSPRLVEIAKSIRRSNASRGLVSTHRRSLSAGPSLETHSKIEKKSTQSNRKITYSKKGLNENDMDVLHKTTNFENKSSTTAKQRNVASNTSNEATKRSQATVPKIRRPLIPPDNNMSTRSRRDQSCDDSCLSGSYDPGAKFTQSLRSYANTKNGTNKRPTIVEPFKLHEPSKAKKDSQPFRSLAELNLKFQTATPERFRTKRSNQDKYPTNEKRTRMDTRLTQPATPLLTAKSRTRGVNFPSREERERMEIEEASQHQFKARPLDKKVLMKPHIETKSKKPVTVIEPFDIIDMKDDDELESIAGSAVKELMEDEATNFKKTHGGISTTWQLTKTEVHPFSFDNRDAEMLRRKKEKIEKVIQEEKKMAEFHANPMPTFERVSGVPEKKAQPPTKPKPLRLPGIELRAHKLQEFENEVKEKEEMEKKQRQFTAQPSKVTIKEPFIPEKSAKPLTDVSKVVLNTEARAKDRAEFDEYIKFREDDLKARMTAFEEEKRKREEEEVRELRRTMVHKAQPVKNFKAFQVKKSETALTIPVTPKFQANRTLRSRSKQRDD